MPNLLPAPRVVEGIIADFRVIFSTTTMTVIHDVKIIAYVITLFAGFVFGWLCLYYPFDGIKGILFFGVISLLAFSFVIPKRSYRYEFDKENQEIRCKWIGFQGIFIIKRKDVCYPLSDLSCLRIEQISTRGRDSFKIKAILYSMGQFELPCGSTLSESIEAANEYRDFLEISAPLDLPR